MSRAISDCAVIAAARRRLHMLMQAGSGHLLPAALAAEKPQLQGLSPSGAAEGIRFPPRFLLFLRFSFERAAGASLCLSGGSQKAIPPQKKNTYIP